jgi:signal transduction histidine kinase
MLTNLVLNAVQAVSDGGTVDVSVSGGDSEAVLVVEDDGPGVPESHRERLFEPFFTTRDEGMGLGLFSVSACVEQHHGSVVVSRSRLGGACFRIVLRPATRDGRSGSPDHREHTPAA